ncbi:hypothetical protein SMSP2_00642 [Limihaloglobus sulfuriphilus]|uniref:Uncharacterized protein n=1 Tax=Limihaloglobus sulfuriphilus TaxID=1851148 RepID=A0A1Q2MCN3_9BACT|nr:hypothetical protein [Limihaloglobus sulfuriphilus]AQQ70298.1 hypothetical protein SMSP2_00642 [Limihaloglobus sulfuriphilus]
MDLNLKDRGRFVIVKHEHRDRPVHWDIMFEMKNNMLAAFRADSDPLSLAENGGGLEKIFDHDRKFLDYEGPVNNGLGSVTSCDAGIYGVSQVRSNALRMILEGSVVSGSFSLSFEQDRWAIERVNRNS